MFKLKPSCENCDKDLAPDATDARICSFECTFCADCVTNVLSDVCPNCGGGFAPRPIRPREDRRNGNYLGKFPASSERVTRRVDCANHDLLAATLGDIAPELR